MAILGYNKLDLAKWLEKRRLAGWLEIATDDLEPLAIQRIAHEIETHYAEAVSAHVATGQPEVSAQDTALAELGDPRVAAANFKKTYLTASEAEWMQAWERIAAKPLYLSSMLRWDLMPVAALALLFPHPRWIINCRLLALVVLMAYSVFRLIPRLLCSRILPRSNFRRALALSSSLPLLFLGLYFALFIYAHRDVTRGFFDVFDIFLAAYLFYFWSFSRNPGWRIWNKLCNPVSTAQAENGTPPNPIIST